MIPKVAAVAGYAPKGGYFLNTLGAMRSRGYVRNSGVGAIAITPEGEAALGEFEPLPTGRALIDYWRSKLPEAQRRIFEAAVAVYPGTSTKIELAEAAGYDAAGGYFLNSLGRLRTLQLIEGRTEIRAAEALFR